MSHSRPPSCKYCSHRVEMCRGAHLRLVIILYIAEDASRSPCPDMFYVSVCCTVFAAPAEFQCKIPKFLDGQKSCIASHCTFSDVNMVIFKSYLDLHLSESDWCGFVVQFGLSDLSEKHSESAFVQNSCTLDMLPDSSACGLKKTWAKQDTET